MWGPTGADAPAKPKDIPALKAALEETGLTLTAQLSEPRTQFMIPPFDESPFFNKLDEGVAIAQELGCSRIVVGSGTGFGGSKRQVQLDKLIDIYTRASAQIAGSGVTLVLEPVNVRVDHPGALLDRTAEAAYVARGVASPFFGVLYDLYHSTVEGEDEATEVGAAIDVIRYVQIADAPGRGEPDPARSTGPQPSPPSARPGTTADRSRVLPDAGVGCVGAPHPVRGGERVSGRYPDAVDVAIVGSGPTGAAYARILTEQAPAATIAMFEVGPTVSNPPGSHVKNIVDPDERRRAQELSEGPFGGAPVVDGPGSVRSGDRRARPGTYLLQSGFQLEGEDGLPVVAFSSNVGGMAAHWTGACPRPGASERIVEIDDLDELLAEGERLLGVTTDAFDGARLAGVVRERLAAAVDAGRSADRRVQKMPLAVRRREDGGLVWGGSDVVLGDDTRGNPRFALHDESLVTRVLLEDGRASGVEVEDRRTGERHVVRARVVVVAADALRTPQLLFASGIRPAALGRTLNDQPQAVFATRLRDVSAEDGATAAGTISERSGVSWVPFTDDLPFHGQIMQLDTSPVPVADDDPSCRARSWVSACSARRTSSGTTASSSTRPRPTTTGSPR